MEERTAVGTTRAVNLELRLNQIVIFDLSFPLTVQISVSSSYRIYLRMKSSSTVREESEMGMIFDLSPFTDLISSIRNDSDHVNVFVFTSKTENCDCERYFCIHSIEGKTMLYVLIYTETNTI